MQNRSDWFYSSLDKSYNSVDDKTPERYFLILLSIQSSSQFLWTWSLWITLLSAWKIQQGRKFKACGPCPLDTITWLSNRTSWIEANVGDQTFLCSLPWNATSAMPVLKFKQEAHCFFRMWPDHQRSPPTFQALPQFLFGRPSQTSL